MQSDSIYYDVDSGKRERINVLTRLRVSGFKNLVDVNVHFGPFTCIAGANGVGKSNLFDAIRFLSALADHQLLDAAMSVRDEGSRTGDVRSLFHRVGQRYDERMDFELEMIVPASGVDDLGQMAKASTTFLRYELSLGYRREDTPSTLGRLEILKEELSYIKRGETQRHLIFKNNPKTWRRTAVTGDRRSKFISTEEDGNDRVIKIHQDGGSRGKPQSLLATNLPRTALSAANAAESPTATMARREMQSWKLLRLEPSALRQPDTFTSPTKLSEDGSHLPATLYHLARSALRREQSSGNGAQTQGFGHEAAAERVYGQVANRLSELITDVREITVDRDERRELLTLMVTGLDQTKHPARALSDGTLRFLALAVLLQDPEARGVICLEEPENGIHPERIPAMLRLLQDIVTDLDTSVGDDNPLRQVIINTHSPAVVSQVPDDSLLLAELREIVRDGERFKALSFASLSGTWRSDIEGARVASRGRLLAYLNPSLLDAGVALGGDQRNTKGRKRVIDRPDLQQYLPFGETA
ncbi:MAG TPA: AAA family ATPase [Bryobacteraceae bacterium]|nr:AAA family ATPase [Bryobacteraceae bacterium]